ncbi:MAG TPA: DUF3570 domain-containing protein [Polyangia bacterium]|nr:DUF3570 domain-containing protein [Polyangia bacterium]
MNRRAVTTLLAALGVVLPSVSVRADGEVTIRGAYYREASTRVIQPVVAIDQNLPQGFDVHTTYLLDAITSASANAGTAKDSIFTELRNEVSLGVGKTWNKTRATLGYIYSAESDYWSHTLHASGSQSFWGDTATVALSLGLSFDQATARNIPRTPFCATAPSLNCPLDIYFAGVSYTQVITPTFIGQLDLESAYLDGFQGNLYRTVPNSPMGFENPPEKRLRNAIAARLAYFFPSTETGLQLHYRYYFDVYPGTAPTTMGPNLGAGYLQQPGYDPWQVQSHTIEGRIYQQLSPTLQARFTLRIYHQSQAAFWCDTLGNPSCYPPQGQFSITGTPESTDPKLGPVNTEYPEVKLIWDAEALRDVPFFRWFAGGTFEISYGYYYQSTSFGDAHVLQTGYTMPY